MTTHHPSPGYCAYLLRCWHEPSPVATDAEGWHFSLEDPHTGTQRGFASFDALMAFLRTRLRNDPGESTGGPADDPAG